MTVGDLTSLKDAAAIAQSLCTVAALLVGAIWAYFKFWRGRVFRPRMTLKADAEMVGTGPTRHVRSTLTMQNVGLSRIVIDRKASWLLVHDQPDLAGPPRLPKRVAPRRHWTFEIFEKRITKSAEEDATFWIEPGATQTRIHVLAMPDDASCLAYLFEYMVVAKKTRWQRHSTLFRTDAIAFRKSAPTEGNTQ